MYVWQCSLPYGEHRRAGCLPFQGDADGALTQGTIQLPTPSLTGRHRDRCSGLRYECPVAVVLARGVTRATSCSTGASAEIP
ncbi:hypothetical protein PAL_GLEAN10003643 [Pteropus alecto]|uniref:Uncharacterized protein n=1 Tax=Pteropus alecto TaxID=9402 RepID=L5L6K1_PTEAL|nr:hypothetical protein PAL_GLEAN10003643 [Pteropus alecto]